MWESPFPPSAAAGQAQWVGIERPVGDREMGVVNSGEEGGLWSTSLGVCIWLAHLS